MLKSDFHIHTKEDPLDIINYDAKTLIKYCSKLNFKVLSITNHKSIYFNNQIKSYAKKHDILLIPGMEARVNKIKDILLLNPPLDFKNPTTFNQLYELKDKHPETLIIAPHPYFILPVALGHKLLIKHINLFDAIEHSNFYTTFINRNKKAVKVAKKHNKSIIATSDAHFLYQINTNFSLIDANQNKDSVLEAIRKNKIKIKSRPLNLYEFARTASLVLRGPFNKKKGLFRY